MTLATLHAVLFDNLAKLLARPRPKLTGLASTNAYSDVNSFS